MKTGISRRAMLGGTAATALVASAVIAPQAINQGADSDDRMLASYLSYVSFHRGFNDVVAAVGDDDDGPYLELARRERIVTDSVPVTPVGMAILALMLIWQSDEMSLAPEFSATWDGLSEIPANVKVGTNAILWNIARCGLGATPPSA